MSYRDTNDMGEDVANKTEIDIVTCLRGEHKTQSKSSYLVPSAHEPVTHPEFQSYERCRAQSYHTNPSTQVKYVFLLPSFPISRQWASAN